MKPPCVTTREVYTVRNSRRGPPWLADRHLGIVWLPFTPPLPSFLLEWAIIDRVNQLRSLLLQGKTCHLGELYGAHVKSIFSVAAGCAWVFLFQLKSLPHDNRTSLPALGVAGTWPSGIASGIFTKADNCTASESLGRRRRAWIKTHLKSDTIIPFL